jgi:hypothetical protein
MPILHNVEIYYVKCDPRRPNAQFNKENPTWELQIRTADAAKKKEWKDMGLGVKDVVPEDGSKPFFRVNLRKKSIREDGSAAPPVAFVNGKLENIDPNTVGNGSVGNVRVYQYEYPKKPTGKGIANVLMGVQVTKHIVYKPKPRDPDFTETETETVGPEGAADGIDDEDGQY